MNLLNIGILINGLNNLKTSKDMKNIYTLDQILYITTDEEIKELP
jgi:hypothetical protein